MNKHRGDDQAELLVVVNAEDQVIGAKKRDDDVPCVDGSTCDTKGKGAKRTSARESWSSAPQRARQGAS